MSHPPSSQYRRTAPHRPTYQPTRSSTSTYTYHAYYNHLLPLVRNLHELRPIGKRHAGGVLLGGDGTGLGLVLDESDALAAGDEADLAEPLEAPEDARERLDVVVVGQVLHEQDLVRRQVLVGHDGGVAGRGARRLEPRRQTTAPRCLRRPVGVCPGCDARAGPLEPLLLFLRFGCFLPLCVVWIFRLAFDQTIHAFIHTKEDRQVARMWKEGGMDCVRTLLS